MSDFLADRQPDAVTVRALWYLDHFAREGRWQHGLSFEKQLRQCRLDYSLSSLSRIDVMLEHIRTKLKPDYDTFFKRTANQQFLFLLAFYCGELYGRQLGTAPVWHDWYGLDAACGRSFANLPEYQFAATYYGGTQTRHYFPLLDLIKRLFPERDGSGIWLDGAAPECGLADEAVLPEAPWSGLDFSMSKALTETPASQLPYLQMLPPLALYGTELMAQIRALPELYRHGRVVWAAWVKADERLFEYGQHDSLTAQIVYDRSGRTDPDSLRAVAKALQELPEGQAVNGRVPYEISHMPVYAAEVWLWRPHLPNGMLTLPVFPILLSEQTDAVTLLPARYWLHTTHYRKWLQQQQALNKNGVQGEQDDGVRGSQETAPAFTALIAAQGNVWRGYQDLLWPQAQQLPELGSHALPWPVGYDAEAQEFVRRCCDAVQSGHCRWQENPPPEAEITACLTALRNGGDGGSFSENVRGYAKLRLMDFTPLLAQLDGLPESMPTGDAAAVAARVADLNGRGGFVSYRAHEAVGPLPPAAAGRTDALLYLAYLYFAGHGVPQSLHEAECRRRYAAALGDGRAERWLAELILHVPEAIPELLKREVIEAAAPFAIQLSADGCLLYGTAKRERQEAAYLQHPQVRQELVRQKLLAAEAGGDSGAGARLRQLIEEGRLPEKAAEARFESILAWLQHDFEQQTGLGFAEMIQGRHEPPLQTETAEKPSETAEDWRQWLPVAAMAAAVLLVLVFAVWNRAPRPAPAAVQLAAPPQETADALAPLRAALPVRLSSYPADVTAVALNNGQITLSLTDRQAAALDAAAAQNLYCREEIFASVRNSGLPVVWTVTPEGGEAYRMAVACPDSSTH